MDVNHDDKISLQEFKDGVKRHPELVDMFFAPADQLDGSQGKGVLAAAAGAEDSAPPIDL